MLLPFAAALFVAVFSLAAMAQAPAAQPTISGADQAEVQVVNPTNENLLLTTATRQYANEPGYYSQVFRVPAGQQITINLTAGTWYFNAVGDGDALPNSQRLTLEAGKAYTYTFRIVRRRI